jgi:hypothetical protein
MQQPSRHNLAEGVYTHFPTLDDLDLSGATRGSLSESTQDNGSDQSQDDDDFPYLTMQWPRQPGRRIRRTIEVASSVFNIALDNCTAPSLVLEWYVLVFVARHHRRLTRVSHPIG